MNNDSDDAYKLAVLAALLDPELCKTKPDEAMIAAEQLLTAASRHEEWRKEQREFLDKKRDEPISYSEAVRFIADEWLTPYPKLYRAKARFTKFWARKHGLAEREARQQLREYEEDKKQFTRGASLELKVEYDAWKSPSKKKGKQGRVKNPEKDVRKRARPAAMPGLKRAFDAGMPDEDEPA
jgi:hypothetical protein